MQYDIRIRKIISNGFNGGMVQPSSPWWRSSCIRYVSVAKARAEFERARAAAPSLETPSQYYENYKNAYDSELARMQDDDDSSNLATSVQALQGAGGSALVGGLSQATAQSQAAQNQMLAQERQECVLLVNNLQLLKRELVGRRRTEKSTTTYKC